MAEIKTWGQLLEQRNAEANGEPITDEEACERDAKNQKEAARRHEVAQYIQVIDTSDILSGKTAKAPNN